MLLEAQESIVKYNSNHIYNFEFSNIQAKKGKRNLSNEFVHIAQ
jgi:hypothetical protein